MKGLDQFLKLFGNITILNVVEIVLAFVFLYVVYKRVKEHLIKTHEADRARDEQIKEALESVRKYPEYRQQSIEIQRKLEQENSALRESQAEIIERLVKIEEQNKRRERNKLRDRLLQNYRCYTNPEINPTLSWTRMEAEAFWELFRDYEEAGGDGYMHSEVQPAMERLKIIEMNK